MSTRKSGLNNQFQSVMNGITGYSEVCKLMLSNGHKHFYNVFIFNFKSFKPNPVNSALFIH